MSVGRVSDANAYTRETVEATDRPVPAKVFIGGPPSSDSSFRVPVGGEQGVHVEMTKDGMAGINRQATISFPTEAFGVDWLQKITNETTPRFNIGAYDPATVQLYSRVQDEYVTVLYGHVTNIGGNGSDMGGRVRINGPATLLNALPANFSFGEGTTARDVLIAVAEAFENQQALYDEVFVIGGDTAEPISASGPLGGFIKSFKELNRTIVGLPVRDVLTTTKRFQPNRDTLADVIEWFERTTESRVWFEPTPTEDEPNLQLFAAAEPSVGIREATHLDGTLRVIDTAIMPTDAGFNALEVVGGRGHEFETPVGDVDVPHTGDKYVVATAFAENLVAEQGLRVAERTKSEYHTETNVANDAKAQLKGRLAQTSGGEDLVTELAPSLIPYVGVETAVDVQQARSPSPATVQQEIHRVSHRAFHDDTSGVVSRTTATTGLYVPLSEIAVETVARDAAND